MDDLRVIRNYQGEDFIKEYQDMFMLMFYLIGVNSIDLYKASPDSIVDGRFEYKRSKTGRLFSIKVEPEAMEIIERCMWRTLKITVLIPMPCAVG